MIEYLLDTNIISDVVRRPTGLVAQRIARIGEHRIAISIISAAELRFGVENVRSERLARQVEAVLATLAVLPFGDPGDVHYARIRTDLHRRGLLIGANDMLIAAHTLAMDVTLVTDNVREFERIDGLRLENWLR
ncbi:MAG: type II toxin-antitoxin system VapC family toxin [Pseudomonadota bacterium]